ncbi:MAG: selenide, water dikinase SelD, partial [Bythopirellula sp.]
MNDSLPQHDIVLLGAGHTNAHILRMWRMQPIADTRLTCVSDYPVATYSGMLAGVLAGQYHASEMEIDLVQLCASCGVRLIQGTVVDLDVERRRLIMEGRPEIRFDVLSVGIGSRPTVLPGGEGGLSIKPMQTFVSRLHAKLAATLDRSAAEPVQLTIVGGGAAGVEVALCLERHISSNYDGPLQFNIRLVEAAERLLPEMPSRTSALAAAELQHRQIELRLASPITHVQDEREIVFADGTTLSSDVIIWATAAQPAELLQQLHLPLDDRGFLQTRNTLQSTGCDDVFAVGDAGTVEDQAYAKAGVYAVRQGRSLWENLRRRIQGKPLQVWQPQSGFLSLINTGDNRAILTYKAMRIHSRWCWWLKDWIDRRFMLKYQQYDPPMMMSAAPHEPADANEQPQCGGCGSKVSASVLRQALQRLDQAHDDDVLLGLDPPDDIALLTTRTDRLTAVSTDFFTAFVDDPFLLGRIAALNALSDLYAKAATPRAALSIAVLPPGSEAQQADLLNELLAGAMHEFGPAGVSIVGGHSIVGPKLTFGFTILGDAEKSEVARKDAVVPGNCLVLTKPLGTGVLLAAHMQAACRAEWWKPLIDAMLLSNHHAATAAREVGVHAATDVTGFGLAVHLLEMLEPAGLAAELSVSSLPILPGSVELLQQGFESTLAPSNRARCQSLELPADMQSKAATKILFDPQTAGGLLLAVPENNLE